MGGRLFLEREERVPLFGVQAAGSLLAGCCPRRLRSTRGGAMNRLPASEGCAIIYLELLLFEKYTYLGLCKPRKKPCK